MVAGSVIPCEDDSRRGGRQQKRREERRESKSTKHHGETSRMEGLQMCAIHRITAAGYFANMILDMYQNILLHSG